MSLVIAIRFARVSEWKTILNRETDEPHEMFQPQKNARNATPFSASTGESDATLAHRMGEGLGVRVMFEVSK